MKTRKVEHDHTGVCKSDCAKEFAPQHTVKSEANHTPTPWFLEKVSSTQENRYWLNAQDAQSGMTLAEVRELSPENAAFIVHAVNNFEAILERLKKNHETDIFILRETRGSHPANCETCLAIAKAEGK